MEKNVILRRAMDFCAYENAKSSNKSIEYRVFEGDDQLIEEGFDGGYDLRLKNEVYRNHGFTVVARSRSDLSVLAQTTLFVTGYDVYKDIVFWQPDDSRTILRKVALGDFRDLVGDLCVTIGFTQMADNIRISADIFSKLKSAMLFYNFIKEIVQSPENFVHFEASGIYEIPDEMLSMDEFLLGDTNIEAETLGEVSPESADAIRFAEKLKMWRMDNLFHDVTLGPVYFSRVGS
ncbi:MAG: hypothetical protein FWG40_02400 [Peptococcaceae bacterium]|nr:hypothetical protein [Peptococcaceae bacterium]